MFSGIVEEIGSLVKIEKMPNLAKLSVCANTVAKGVKSGDSISVAGVCLTLTKRQGNVLGFDVMKETLDKTTLGLLKKNDKVNLERALKVGERISGHFVTGHIDGTGKIIKIIKQKNYTEMHINVPRNVLGFVAPKGSVTVDGVSLTVGIVGKHYFSFFLIPYTQEITTLGLKKEGNQVNVEADVLAKYVLNRYV